MILLLPFLLVPVLAQIDCPSGSLSQQARANVISSHNAFRSNIARGQSIPGPKGGKNINALTYSCGLELLAQTHANTCPTSTSPPSVRPGIGQNYYRLLLPEARVSEPDAFTHVATQWWNQVVVRGWTAGPDNVYTDAVARTKIESYAQMAWGDTTLVGCGMYKCRGFRSVVCNYMTRGAIIGQPIVQPGTGCQVDADCTTFPGSTCDTVLQICNVPPGTNPVPGLPPTTTTTTAAGALPHIDCPTGTLSQQARANVISTHNTFRSNIARGQSIPGPKGGRNINALTYSCSLELLAQAHANTCRTSTSPPSVRPGIGQNYYRLLLPETKVSEPDAFTHAATQWWNQVVVRGWTAGPDNVYTTAVSRTRIESYAQMAWGDTILVGCGMSKCRGFRSVVCNYMTRGPIVGQAMVQPGTGCQVDADCTTFPGSTCDVALQLCNVPPGTNPVPGAVPVPAVVTATTTTTTTVATTTTTSGDCGGSPFFTADIRNTIVDRHNTLRSNIAKGQLVSAIVTRGCQNMFEMEYDCALEEAAQKQADECDIARFPAERGRNVFENNANPSAADAVDAALTLWEGEATPATFRVNAPLSSVAGEPNQVSVIGQFAQMAYSRAWGIGCGYARCSAADVMVVCRYRLPRSDTAPAYSAVTTNLGCTQAKCAAVNNTAICDAASGLCQLP